MNKRWKLVENACNKWHNMNEIFTCIANCISHSCNELLVNEGNLYSFTSLTYSHFSRKVLFPTNVSFKQINLINVFEIHYYFISLKYNTFHWIISLCL